MICRTCQKENHEEAVYCAHCGQPLDLPGTPVATLRFGTKRDDAPSPPSSAPKPPQDKKPTSNGELKSLLKDILSKEPKRPTENPHGTSPGGLPEHLKKAPLAPNATPFAAPSVERKIPVEPPRPSPKAVPPVPREAAPKSIPTERVAVLPLEAHEPKLPQAKPTPSEAQSGTFEALPAATMPTQEQLSIGATEPSGEFEFAGLADSSDTGYEIQRPVVDEDGWEIEGGNDTFDEDTEQAEVFQPKSAPNTKPQVESFSSFVRQLRDPSPQRPASSSPIKPKSATLDPRPAAFSVASPHVPAKRDKTEDEPAFTRSSTGVTRTEIPPSEEIYEGMEDEYEEVQVVAAGFPSRILAGAIDHGVTFVLWLLLLALVKAVFGAENLPVLEASGPFGLIALGLDYPTLLAPLYLSYLFLFASLYLLFHCTTGQTPGKLVMGLRTIQTDGERVGFSRGLVRFLGYWISLLVAGVGLLWILLDSKKQGFHDKLAGSLVIRVQ